MGLTAARLDSSCEDEVTDITVVLMVLSVTVLVTVWFENTVEMEGDRWLKLGEDVQLRAEDLTLHDDGFLVEEIGQAEWSPYSWYAWRLSMNTLRGGRTGLGLW